MCLRLSQLLMVISFGLLVCESAQAGYIVVGATVTHVSSTNGNNQAFQVQVAGGTGPCANATGSWVIFPLSAAADADAHKRAYAAALLALTTGMRVTFVNYSNDSCNGASYVDIHI